MIPNLDQLKSDLLAQRQVLEDLFAELRRAKIAGAPPPGNPERKNFLALLSHSLDTIRRNRNAWLRLDPAKKGEHPEVVELLRESQNLILKILVLARENEQARTRGPENGTAPADAPSAAEGSPLLARIYRRQPPS